MLFCTCLDILAATPSSIASHKRETRSYIHSPSSSSIFPHPVHIIGIYHAPEHEEEFFSNSSTPAQLPSTLETLAAEVKGGFGLAVALLVCLLT
jgi:hypothetical protein